MYMQSELGLQPHSQAPLHPQGIIARDYLQRESLVRNVAIYILYKSTLMSVGRSSGICQQSHTVCTCYGRMLQLDQSRLKHSSAALLEPTMHQAQRRKPTPCMYTHPVHVHVLRVMAALDTVYHYISLGRFQVSFLMACMYTIEKSLNKTLPLTRSWFGGPHKYTCTCT